MHPPPRDAAMTGKLFGLVVKEFTERLEFFYANIEIDHIEKQKNSLQDAFRTEPSL